MIKKHQIHKKTLDYKQKLTYKKWKCTENALQCQPQTLCNSL